jgi:hypothetical protein
LPRNSTHIEDSIEFSATSEPMGLLLFLAAIATRRDVAFDRHMGIRKGVMIMRCDSVCQNQEIFQLGMGIGGCRGCTALHNNIPRIPSLMHCTAYAMVFAVFFTIIAA